MSESWNKTNKWLTTPQGQLLSQAKNGTPYLLCLSIPLQGLFCRNRSAGRFGQLLPQAWYGAEACLELGCSSIYATGMCACLPFAQMDLHTFFCHLCRTTPSPLLPPLLLIHKAGKVGDRYSTLCLVTATLTETSHGYFFSLFVFLGAFHLFIDNVQLC